MQLHPTNAKLSLKTYLNFALTYYTNNVLRQELGEKQDFNDYKNHNENWCLAYGRDRGEPNTEAKTFDYIGAFLEYARGSWAEYAYIFTLANGWAYWSLTTPEPTVIKPSLVMA